MNREQTEAWLALEGWVPRKNNTTSECVLIRGTTRISRWGRCWIDSAYIDDYQSDANWESISGLTIDEALRVSGWNVP